MVTNESHATLYICMHGCRFSVGAHRCAIEAPSEPVMRPKIASAVVAPSSSLEPVIEAGVFALKWLVDADTGKVAVSITI